MGLHVAWLKILARWIEYAAQHTTVIIATHSPDLLDCFTESYDSVICFEPNRDGTTQLKSVGESQLKSRLDEGWELGDLYRVGDPSIGAWP
jgi:predicted ATPase